jgi:hypoxanthine phosphoribosyltransferase
VSEPSSPGDIVEPRFAHASEAEFARILDFYQVAWDYEPQVFPILWDLEGNVLESFAPDFFLPDLDLFVELTTLQQRLVRKKNRKVRRLRELYPNIRIKLFYARDFRALMLKYGRSALASELSGTVGQVVARSEAESTDGPTDALPRRSLDLSGAAVSGGSFPTQGSSRGARRRAVRKAAAAYAPTAPPT